MLQHKLFIQCASAKWGRVTLIDSFGYAFFSTKTFYTVRIYSRAITSIYVGVYVLSMK